MTTTQNLPATEAQTGDTLNGQPIARVVKDRKNLVLVFANGGRSYMSLAQARLTHVSREVAA